MHDANEQIQSQNKIINLDELVQPQIEAIMGTARGLCKGLLEKLETDYAKELRTNYRPSFWNPNKARNLAKVKMARELQSALNKDINSLRDIEMFISFYKKMAECNKSIDPRGGRFDKILQSKWRGFEELQLQILNFHNLNKNVNYLISKVIRHLIALEKEAWFEEENCFSEQHQLRAIDVKASNDYHQHQIDHAKSQLMELFAKIKEKEKLAAGNNAKAILDNLFKNIKAKCDEIDYQGMCRLKDQLLGLFYKTKEENKLAVSKVKIIINEIFKKISCKCDELDYQKKHESPGESNTIKAEKALTAKVDYLQTLLREYEIKQLDEEIIQSIDSPNSKQDAIQRKVQHFACAELVRSFGENIKMESKFIFWKSIVHLINAPPDSYLSGTELRKNKEAWCKGCYSAIFKGEEYGASQNYKDPLHLEWLTDRLISLGFAGCPCDELVSGIDLSTEMYFSKRVNKDIANESSFERHKVLVFTDWQKHFSLEVEKLKSNIRKVFEISNHLFADKNIIATTTDEAYILKLLQSIRGQVEAVDNKKFKNTALTSENSPVQMPLEQKYSVFNHN